MSYLKSACITVDLIQEIKIKVIPLGGLPATTKLNSHFTSLAILTKQN